MHVSLKYVHVVSLPIFAQFLAYSCCLEPPGTWNQCLCVCFPIPNGSWCFSPTFDLPTIVVWCRNKFPILCTIETEYEFKSCYTMVLFEGAPNKRSVLFMNYEILKSERWHKGDIQKSEVIVVRDGGGFLDQAIIWVFLKKGLNNVVITFCSWESLIPPSKGVHFWAIPREAPSI